MSKEDKDKIYFKQMEDKSIYKIPMCSYTDAKIYKITNSIDDEVYVGSTTQDLNKRLAKHCSNLRHQKTGKIYDHMRTHGVDAFKIELIENFACNDQKELRLKEGEWIRKLGTLNLKMAGRTPKQYRIEHAEFCKSWNKLWRMENKEYDAMRKKKWTDANKEHVSEYHKNYREKHKDELKTFKETKILCECGCKIARANIAKHRKTEKHFKNLEKQYIYLYRYD